MSEGAEQQADALFKPNKRRKVFRKRHTEDEEDKSAATHQLPGEANAMDIEGDDDDKTMVVRRPHNKKPGIAFGVSAKQSSQQQTVSLKTALVPLQNQESATIPGDRFIKPVTKAEVVEDKHLTAFLDSKLAELRSPQPNPQPERGEDVQNNSSPQPTQEEESSRLEPKAPLISAAQNKDYLTRSQRKEKKALRRRPTRDSEHVARDDLIDQILRESEVPMYDQGSTKAPNYDDYEGDHDEAAARAFKAQFLIDMENHKRRKPPPGSAAAKATAPVSTGPKLGGSRSMREKMKAIEAAKNQPGPKK